MPAFTGTKPHEVPQLEPTAEKPGEEDEGLLNITGLLKETEEKAVTNTEKIHYTPQIENSPSIKPEVTETTKINEVPSSNTKITGSTNEASTWSELLENSI